MMETKKKKMMLMMTMMMTMMIESKKEQQVPKRCDHSYVHSEQVDKERITEICIEAKKAVLKEQSQRVTAKKKSGAK